MQLVSRIEQSAPSKIAASTFVLVLGILFVAANLRAPITGIAPILERIIHTFTLSWQWGFSLVGFQLWSRR